MSRSNWQLIRRTSVVLVGVLLFTGYLTMTRNKPSNWARPHQGHITFLPAAATLAPQDPLPRTGWTATAGDEETAGENGAAANVLDGEAGTHWHSKWTAPEVPLPHTI